VEYGYLGEKSLLMEYWRKYGDFTVFAIYRHNKKKKLIETLSGFSFAGFWNIA